MRISDWSSVVCSSDLVERARRLRHQALRIHPHRFHREILRHTGAALVVDDLEQIALDPTVGGGVNDLEDRIHPVIEVLRTAIEHHHGRSEEHTSELQSLMRNSYAVFCLKKKKDT